MRRCVRAVALVLMQLVIACTSPEVGRPSVDRMADLPSVFLWAWERREDLSFIDPSQVGVAFLCGTIELDGSDVAVRPRMQPLRTTVGTPLIAVVRIESGLKAAPMLSASQGPQVVSAIVQLTSVDAIVAVQVDYDARMSERPFYRAFWRTCAPRSRQ